MWTLEFDSWTWSGGMLQKTRERRVFSKDSNLMEFIAECLEQGRNPKVLGQGEVSEAFWQDVAAGTLALDAGRLAKAKKSRKLKIAEVA